MEKLKTFFGKDSQMILAGQYYGPLESLKLEYYIQTDQFTMKDLKNVESILKIFTW